MENLLKIKELTEMLSIRDEKLMEDEELFRKIFDINPVPMSITTLEDGKYIKINQALLEVSGYTEEEVLDKSVNDMGVYQHPEDRIKIREELLKGNCIKNRPIIFNVKNGKKLNVVFSADIVTINHIKYVLGVVLVKDEIC